MLRTIALSTCLVLFLLLPGSATTPRVNALPADSPPAASEPPQPIDPITGMPAGRGAAAATAPAAPDAAPSKWVKYEGNPVLGPGEPGSWDADTVGVQSVMFKDGVYKMWYGGTSNDNTVIRIGYATSPDRVTWTKHAGNPVLSEGPPGVWDSGYVFSPFVLFHNGIYHMWYRGASVAEVTAAAAFGYATSNDGVNWVKHASNPVLRVGPEGSWDSMSLWSLSVLVEGNTFKMWYSGRNEAWQYQIGYATSTNGIKWKKHAQNPVLRIGEAVSWDDDYAYFPYVIASGGLYEMWYTGSDGYYAAIGYATSVDGITWHKPAANPVMWTGRSYTWDERWVGGQFVILDHGVYRMWYAGIDRYGNAQIGHATAPPPFDPALHGYGFANAGVGSPIGASDLRAEELIRLFGVDAVCWSAASVCSVKPTAEMWRVQANATLAGGQSDGMAVTSLRYYLGFDQTEQFQPGALVAHDLQADSSRHNIALYQARQLTNPVRSYKTFERTLTQGAMIYWLKDDPAGNGAYADTLYLRQAGMGGHTLLPYALEDQGNGVYWVRVYDANYPDDPNRHVVLTTADESWSYDMGGELGTWSGNAASASMGLMSNYLYSERSVCPWCPIRFEEWQVWLAGRGHLLIQDEEGKGIGFANGQFVDEFLGATAESIDGGTGRVVEPVYTIPLSETFTIILDGQTVTQTETVAVTRYGQGTVAGAEQVTIDPAARDEITMDADGAKVVYRSNQAKEITLKMAMDEENASHSFMLRGVDIGAGEAVGLENRRAERQLVFTNQTNGAGTYQLVVTRHDATGVKLFVHTTVEAAAQDTHYLSHSSWIGTGPMTLSVDHGSDGSIDETIRIENEVTSYYLPVIGR